MKRHPVRKGLVALATVVSFVALVAAPAASQAEIQAGYLYVGGEPPTNPDLILLLGGSAPPGPCRATLNNDVDPFYFDANPGSGTWWTSGGFAGMTQLGTDWVKAVIDLSDLSGMMTPGPPGDEVLSGGGQISIHLWDVHVPDPPDPDEECEKNDFICTITVDVVLIAASFYMGSQPPAPGFGQLELNADSISPHLQAPLLQCGISIWLLFHGKGLCLRNLLINPAQ